MYRTIAGQNYPTAEKLFSEIASGEYLAAKTIHDQPDSKAIIDALNGDVEVVVEVVKPDTMAMS